MESGKVTCELCRKAVSIDDIKYMPKGTAGKIALCPECRSEGKKEAPKKADKALPEKEQFFCTRCSYRFKTHSFGQVKLGCPNCGLSDKVMKYSKLDADEIIKSAEEK